MRRYEILFRPAAVKELERLPEAIQRRIVRAVEGLAVDPRPAGCVRLAGDENAWRIRIGAYRVLYEIEDARLIVLVVRVGHRKDVCRGK